MGCRRRQHRGRDEYRTGRAVTGEQPPGPPRRGPVERVLHEEAGPRRWTLNEHMFAVETPTPRPATFRLQLFTAPGRSPVAVATQAGWEGPSLINGAERYAAAVWQRHFPADQQPPIWIQRQFLPGGEPDPFQLVTFTAAGRYTLTGPCWCGITPGQLAQLVGGPVDDERGERYVPRPAEPEDELHYEPMLVVGLPRPDPFRHQGCMVHGTPWWRRVARQVFPRKGPCPRGRVICAALDCQINELLIPEPDKVTRPGTAPTVQPAGGVVPQHVRGELVRLRPSRRVVSAWVLASRVPEAAPRITLPQYASASASSSSCGTRSRFRRSSSGCSPRSGTSPGSTGTATPTSRTPG